MINSLLLIIAVLLRIFSNPAANVFQKQLSSKGNHPLLVNFITYLLLSLGCLIIAINIQWPVLGTEFWTYAILDGIAGAAGNAFLVRSLQTGELSILGPINSYKAVVGIIIGIFLLGEVPGLWGIAGIILIIYGSYFVLDTTEEKFSFALLKKKEIQFRICAMILTAIEAVFIKKVILASSAGIAFFSWCWFGAFFSFILLLIYRVNMKQQIGRIHALQLRQYILLIICIGTMQFTTNYTFDHMQVGYALSLFQLSVIISVILGHRFFNEKDILKKLIGSVIMIAGSVMIILPK